MPRGKRYKALDQIEDMTGAYKMQRWRVCEAYARALYRSKYPVEDLKEMIPKQFEIWIDLKK